VTRRDPEKKPNPKTSQIIIGGWGTEELIESKKEEASKDGAEERTKNMGSLETGKRKWWGGGVEKKIVRTEKTTDARFSQRLRKKRLEGQKTGRQKKKQRGNGR